MPRLTGYISSDGDGARTGGPTLPIGIEQPFRRTIDVSAMSRSVESDTEKTGNEVLSVGHSALSYESFRDLLREYGVEAIADVRSTPYSRRYPHFSRPELRSRLKADKISYVFLGKELGGRPDSPALFSQGVADYEKMAQTDAFESGLQRVVEGASKLQIALMCSEQNPLDCHRCLLVGRALKRKGMKVSHILDIGTKVSHDAIEAKLLQMDSGEHDDFFVPAWQRLDDAYRARAQKVAFTEKRLEDELSNDMER